MGTYCSGGGHHASLRCMNVLKAKFLFLSAFLCSATSVQSQQIEVTNRSIDDSSSVGIVIIVILLLALLVWLPRSIGNAIDRNMASHGSWRQLAFLVGLLLLVLVLVGINV